MKEKMIEKLKEQAAYYYKIKAAFGEESANDESLKFYGMMEIAEIAGITAAEITKIVKEARANA